MFYVLVFNGCLCREFCQRLWSNVKFTYCDIYVAILHINSIESKTYWSFRSTWSHMLSFVLWEFFSCDLVLTLCYIHDVSSIRFEIHYFFCSLEQIRILKASFNSSNNYSFKFDTPIRWNIAINSILKNKICWFVFLVYLKKN
jgi:hypothetical protein